MDRRARRPSRDRLEPSTLRAAPRVWALLGALACGSSSSNLAAIVITPATATVAIGATQPLMATGRFGDGASRSLGPQVAWTSSAPAIAYVSDQGVVTAVTPGSATVAVTPAGQDGGPSGSAQITVPTPSFAALQTSPAALTLAVGQSQTVTVIGIFGADGGLSLQLASGLGWSSSSTAVATVDSTGLVTGVALGMATITATLSTTGQSASLPVTVSSSVLSALAITPATFVVSAGSSLQLTATGTFSNGSLQNLSSSVVWTSSSPAVATVDVSGLLSALTPGATTVTASLAGQSAMAMGTVASGVTNSPEVFVDGYAAGVTFEGFGTGTNSVSVDTTTERNGHASLAITLPSSNYTGGAFVATPPRDLSGYSAVTFWAMATQDITFSKAGVGNDNTASTPLAAEWDSIPITTTWTQFIIPVPLPSAFSAEDGLFYFANSGASGTLWLNDIEYANFDAGVIGPPSPSMTSGTFTKQIGDSLSVSGAAVTFSVNGVSEKIIAQNGASWSYFDFASSNPAVASVDALGNVLCLDAGSSVISATLGSLPVTGTLSLTVSAGGGPAAAPPEPPAATPSSVISLDTTVYTNVPVDTWGASWSNSNAGANESDVVLDGDTLKKYEELAFAGIEFYMPGPVIDASAMNAIHLDVWTPDSTLFAVKLVDFGADAEPGGSGADADSQAQVNITPSSTPPLQTGTWMSLDLPLSSFTALTSRAHLGQLIISGSTSTVYLDDVYFHQ